MYQWTVDQGSIKGINPHLTLHAFSTWDSMVQGFLIYLQRVLVIIYANITELASHLLRMFLCLNAGL